MDLTLYKMAPTGRINLTGLAANRETYFTGARDADTGVITLTPVNIVGATTRRESAPAADEAEPETPTGETPWDQ